MKILHTADLHLGRQFNGLSLDDDHAVVLDQIVDALIQHDAQVLIIAGDVYDRAAPPQSAVRQFNGFLSRVASETDAAVVMIAGNHDSGDRVAAMSIMPNTQRALIRGVVSANELPLVLNDEFGPVAFSGLPFCYEYAARECFADETLSTPEDVLSAQVAAARKNISEGSRWVIVAHAFVAGAQNSDGERPLTRVGGIETVRPEIFDGASYVALGHLHRPQNVGADHIRYSGSPLAFGFDEADHEKSMCLVDIDAAGQVKVEQIPFCPLHKIRVIRGQHAELIGGQPSRDFLKAILTDESRVIEAMKRLREVYPNACQLSYQRDERPAAETAYAFSNAKTVNPIELIEDFLQQVREASLSEREQKLVTGVLQDLQQEENAV